MRCPICDQKAMNCDCTPEERRQFSEIEDLQEEIARLRITDAEREAIKEAMEGYAEWMNDDGVLHPEAASTVATLRGLLARCAIGHQ